MDRKKTNNRVVSNTGDVSAKISLSSFGLVPILIFFVFFGTGCSADTQQDISKLFKGFFPNQNRIASEDNLKVPASVNTAAPQNNTELSAIIAEARNESLSAPESKKTLDSSKLSLITVRLTPKDDQLVRGTVSVNMVLSDDKKVDHIELVIDKCLSTRISVGRHHRDVYSVLWDTHQAPNGRITINASAYASEFVRIGIAETHPIVDNHQKIKK